MQRMNSLPQPEPLPRFQKSLDNKQPSFLTFAPTMSVLWTLSRFICVTTAGDNALITYYGETAAAAALDGFRTDPRAT